MAGEDTAVVVTLRAATKDYEAAMKTALRTTERAAAAAEKAVSAIGKGSTPGINQAKRNMDQLRNSIRATEQQAGGLKGLLSNLGSGGLGGIIGAGVGGFLGGAAIGAVEQLGSALVALLDINTRINNSLKIVGITGKDLDRVYAHLAETAKANGAEFETLTQLYAQVTRSSEALGLSQKDVTLFVDRMAQGLRASGTSSAQASDGLRQLNQALASGVLRGDEFNSVAENLPVVARAIADGLHVTIGQLRTMASEGKLTAKVVYDAFIAGSAGFEAQSAKTSTTIGGSFENIRTSLITTVGAINDLTQASQGAAAVLNLVAEAITLIGTAAEKASQVPMFAEIMKTLAATAGGPLVIAAQVTQAVTGDDKKKLPSDMMSDSDVVRGRALGKAQRDAATGTEEHERAVQALKASYLELGNVILNSRSSVENLVQTTARLSPEEADKLEAAYNKVADQIRHGVIPNVDDLKTLMEDLRATGDETGQSMADSFQKYLDKMGEAAKAFEQHKVAAQELADVIAKSVNGALNATLELMGKITGSTNNWVEAFRAASQIAGTVQGQLAQFPGLQPGAVQGVPGGLTPQGLTFTPSEAKTFLKTRAASTKVQERMDAMDEEFATALAKLLVLLPKATIISGVRTNAEQREIWERSKHGTLFAAAPPGHSRHERGAATDIGGVSSADLQAAVKQIPELETLARINDDMHVQLKKGSDAADENAAAITKQSTALDDWLLKSQQAIDLKTRENEIDKDFTATSDEKAIAKEREAFIQDGLNAVMEQYGVISDENRAKVVAAADAQARLGLAAENTALAQKKATDAAKAQADAAQEFSQQIGQLAESAISGLVNDLRNGVDAGEAFNNMLNRIIDSLIQMALQSIFSPAGGAGGGGWIAKLFGLAKGGVVGKDGTPQLVDMRTFRGAKSYASGGMIPGGGVPIIAHPGELVIPRNLAKAGVSIGGGSGKDMTAVTNQVGSIVVDMSGSGLVTGSSQQGKLLGRQIEAAVQVVLTKESRPGGILRKQGAP